MALDIKAEVEKLRTLYKEDPRQHTFNALVLGESGVGKSFLARSARKPVHIDSFDPGGTKGLRPWIESGDVVVDSSYESEDRMNPHAFNEWKQNFTARLQSGYFDHFSTYMLDSATTWSESIMNSILKKSGLAGEAPRFTKDYTPQKITIQNWLRKMIDLPCDFILTGHLKLVEEVDGKPRWRFMTTGQGMVIIPLLFDEIYVLNTKESSAGVNYRLLTKATDNFLARSRLASDKVFDTYEKPDIKHLLAKAGMPTQDKPKLA